MDGTLLRYMSLKSRVGLAFFLTLFLLSIYSAPFVLAQSTLNSYTVNLTYLSVQLSYPSEVRPGENVTVNIQGSAKSSLSSVSLTVQFDYANGSNLRHVASITLGNSNGGSIIKQVQFTIPQDAPRTSLMALLTENVQTALTGNTYSSPNCYCGYCNTYASSPYCYYNYGNYYCYYNYNGYGYGTYPSYSSGISPPTSNTTSDSVMTPLSYIKATTPEYVSLQAEYQMVQQQLGQSQAENQQLRQNLQNTQSANGQKDAIIANLNQQLQNAQNANNQKNATIADLNQQLNAAQVQNGSFGSLSTILIVILVVLALFVTYLWRGNRTPMRARVGTEPA